MATNTIDEKIAKAEAMKKQASEKLRALIEAKAKKEARLRTAENKENRKQTENQKALFGAYIINRLKASNVPLSQARFEFVGSDFLAYLSRDSDKKAFNL